MSKVPKLKTIVALGTALFIVGAAHAQQQAGHLESQGAGHQMLSQENMKMLTDARLNVAKAVLQLRSDQEKYWPAIENAVRRSAEDRYHRISALASRIQHAREGGEINPIEVMQHRADALAQRSDNLKRVAEAWQPLYQSLSQDQKDRVRLVATHVLGRMREALESRRMEAYEEGEEAD